MPKISGAKEASGRLRGMAGREMVELVGQALVAGGELIQTYAQGEITRGAVSGKFHVPSKPGEFPKNDEGILAAGIEVHQIAPLRVQVSSNAPHAVPLEAGTSKMAARPHMGPSARAKRAEVVAKVERAVSIATKRK